MTRNMLCKFAKLVAFGIVAFGGLSCQHTKEAGSKVKANGDSVGDYKGFDVIDAYISEHVVSQPGFTLARYLPANAAFGSGSLKSLLGTYIDFGGATVFENATPNALNVALWQAIFMHLATDLAAVCDAPAGSSAAAGSSTPAPGPVTSAKLQLNTTFAAAATPLCSWPADTAKNDANMAALWSAVMLFQAPEAEYPVFRDWFLNQPSYTQASGKSVLTAMLVAMMMNPYFLLSD